MAQLLSDRWFENPAAGQRVRLITLPAETAGRSFVIEYISRPLTGERAVPPHFHPCSAETFEILKGRAKYRIGDTVLTASAGDTITLPKGIVHVHPWSGSDEELHVRQTSVSYPPDVRGLTASLQAVVTIFGLASTGRANRKGEPSLLQLALLAKTTMPSTYLAGPPVAIQRVVIGALAGVGRIAGYRATYPEFIQVPTEVPPVTASDDLWPVC